VSCTVSFIQIRRAAHSFKRDSVASATSQGGFRADADRSQVTGQLGWEIFLTVCFSGFVDVTRRDELSFEQVGQLCYRTIVN
jgi:hypothetical protein